MCSAIRVAAEPASNPNYKDANKLANVVTPDEPKHAAVLRGENVPPDPVNAKPRKVEAAPPAPAWTTPTPAAAWSRLTRLVGQPAPPEPNGVSWRQAVSTGRTPGG